MNNIMYVAPLLAVVGLLVMVFKARWVKSQDSGSDRMKEISKSIKEGALAFLGAEYRLLLVFVIIASGALFAISHFVDTTSWMIIPAFIIGAVFSALAGNIGMRIATEANARTAEAAKTSLPQALKVSFGGGTVMGLGVAGLAVLGLSLLLWFFLGQFMTDDGSKFYMEMTVVLETLAGFSLGAESIALFARVGGGIYTKAADVGADLVGKVEAGIPEDDPRNPATIADNVGDNVGDVAGMGADLFGSYVATVLAAMVLGNYIIKDMSSVNQFTDTFNNMGPILLPLVIAGVGVVSSIIGTFLVRIKDNSAKEAQVQRALDLGNWVSILITLVASYFLIDWMLPDVLTMAFFGETDAAGEQILRSVPSINVFYSACIGLAVGALISMVTAHYTSLGKKPVMDIVQNSSTGAATNIIAGLAVGMKSTFFSVILFAAAIYGSYALAGFYGVALAASAMMATTAMQLAIDAFGPIADNAGGVAEMSELEDHVRERTDILDSVGNTTAAVGKGFAIASAALTALALFAAYVTFTGIDGINIFKADVLSMLFVGGMIPVIFSALAMQSVGRAAMEMVQEVRRQFREIPGIMEGKGTPEYAKCVDISTRAALKEMILPGLITIITPILIGLLFGAEPLGGYMAGVCVSGVMWAIFQNNAGGAWDNAKKSFEAGVMINGEMTYKGSEAHKAAVTGDTVGDPFKDTSGPSMNILIKLTCLVGLVIAPILGGHTGETEAQIQNSQEQNLTTTQEQHSNPLLSGVYNLNPDNTEITWVAKKVTGQHNGNVDAMGNIKFEDNLITAGEIGVDMGSITVLDIKDDESNADLVNHLRGPDFFDAETYPNAKLSIDRAYEAGNGSYEFTGNMSIKGVTNPVTGKYSISNGKVAGVFEFDRSQYDIKYRSASFFDNLGDKMIYDDVIVGFEVKI